MSVSGASADASAKASCESVSIVVPTYRRPDALSVTLAALVDIDYPSTDMEIIVVDDGNDDATVAAVRNWVANPVSVRVLSQGHKGAAAARNRGAEAAEGDLLLFCDDDIVVERSHLRLQRETRETYGPHVLVNGEWNYPPQVVAALRATPFGRFRLELQRRFDAEFALQPLSPSCFAAPCLSACNLFLARALFWELGGFDPAFPHAGAEDQDLSLRATDSGCALVVNREIRVLHNDQILAFEGFCRREENSAKTVVVLARKFPTRGPASDIYAENALISRGDPRALKMKKLAKRLVSGQLQLRACHIAVAAAELLPIPESWLHRLYRAVIGVHIFRGVRHVIQSHDP